MRERGSFAGECRVIGGERDLLDTPVPLIGLQELVVVEEARVEAAHVAI